MSSDLSDRWGRSLGAEVVLGATVDDGLIVTSRGVTTTLAGADLIGLEALARTAREAAPKDILVSVRAAESVPLWRLTEVLNALRGSDCWGMPMSDETERGPARCLLYYPILDLETDSDPGS